MTRLRRGAGATAFVLVSFVVLAAAPAARAAGDSLVIRKVDTTGFPEVVVSAMHTGTDVTADAFALRENGRIVPDVEVVPIGKTATPVDIALVIDTSGSMRGPNLEAARAAAREFVARKQPNEQIAIVSFSDEPRVLVNFTDDSTLLTAAIDGLEAHGETALWDAVRVSSGLFSERRGGLANAVVLSDGADTVSRSSPDDALGSAIAEKAAVFAVGLTGGGEFDRAPLERLAAATSGLYVETTDPRQLGVLYEAIQRQIQNQFELTYQSPADAREIEVSVAAAGLTAVSTAPTGTVASGPGPRVVEPAPVPAPLRSAYAGAVVSVLVALAAAAGVIAIASLVRRRQTTLDEALQPYFGLATAQVARGGEQRTARTLAQTALVRRAVDYSTRFASDRGLVEFVEKRLEQADLRLRAQEALFFFVAGVVVVTVGAFAALGPLAALGAFALVGLGPIALVNFLAGRRQRVFSAQLPDTLQLLASSLRAGYSLQQGIETVAREISGPMGRELRRVVIESTLARPLEEALADSAARMESPDFDWAVIAIRIQREVGGNLAELLTTVADTMIARDRLRREVRALTAEGRFSAIILLALPLVLGGVIFVINPSYMQPLFRTTLGQLMVAGAGLLAGAGFVWMRKIVEIRV